MKTLKSYLKDTMEIPNWIFLAIFGWVSFETIRDRGFFHFVMLAAIGIAGYFVLLSLFQWRTRRKRRREGR